MRSIARVDKESNLVVGLIPARYHSTRFEGKPLKEILGLPMIHRVYNQATQSKLLDSVIVLTDDTSISQYCSSEFTDIWFRDFVGHCGNQ